MSNIPKAIGPYSSHRKVGNIIFTSGQLPIDPETSKLVEGSMVKQVEQSLLNIEAILQSEGTDLSHVVKFTVYLTDLSKFGEVNEAFEKKLSSPFPARTAIQIGALPMNGEVEIEAIAAI